MRAKSPQRAAGATLVELIITIVVVGIALASIMSVFVVTTQHSADPMARVQAQILAEGYLDEILLKKFYDTTTSKVCPAGAPSHASYVCGYNGLSEVPIAGYTAIVAVTSAGVTLNGLNNASVIRVLQVDVTVTGPGSTITLTGYRANYECNAAGDPGCVPL
jgi:MSHA pilin protein MshD